MTSKTKAIETARHHISGLYGDNAHGYEVYGPYNANNLDGPSTSIKAADYQSAVRKRKAWVARLALVILGYDQRDVWWQVAEDCEGDVWSIVTRAAAKIENQTNAKDDNDR